MFADESTIQLLPNVVRTYAPRGQTPCLKYSNRPQKVYVISAISAEGNLYYQTRDTRFTGMGIVRFLDHLINNIKRRILLVWDGATVHFSHYVKDFLMNLGPDRLNLFKLPSNSPELNPDEQVWAFLKNQSELRNFAAKNFTELRHKVRQQLELLKQQPERIKKMFHHPDCGYY